MQHGRDGCAQCRKGLPAGLQDLGLAHVLCQAAAGRCGSCSHLGGHCLEGVQSLLGAVLNITGVGLQVVAQGSQVLATLCGALLELFEVGGLGSSSPRALRSSASLRARSAASSASLAF